MKSTLKIFLKKIGKGILYITGGLGAIGAFMFIYFYLVEKLGGLILGLRSLKGYNIPTDKAIRFDIGMDFMSSLVIVAVIVIFGFFVLKSIYDTIVFTWKKSKFEAEKLKNETVIESK